MFMRFAIKGSDLIYGSAVTDERPRCNSINTDINSNGEEQQTGRGGTLPRTVISEEKVPHLALWQQNEALSDLMDYIDTPVILMTLSIFPSPLSFLSLLPSPWPCSCILPQFKDPETGSQG